MRRKRRGSEGVLGRGERVREVVSEGCDGSLVFARHTSLIQIRLQIRLRRENALVEVDESITILVFEGFGVNSCS